MTDMSPESEAAAYINPASHDPASPNPPSSESSSHNLASFPPDSQVRIGALLHGYATAITARKAGILDEGTPYLGASTSIEL